MKDPNSIMAPSDKQTGIITNDSVFINSEVLFVEYYDVIKAPWLVFLTLSKYSEMLNTIVDLDYMLNVDRMGWLEWYTYRKTRNPLLSFKTNEDLIASHGSDVYDIILDKEMDNEAVIKVEAALPFLSVLASLINNVNIVKNIYVWTPTYHKPIESDLSLTFENSVKYVYGTLQDVLKNLSTDTTYVFSDINHVNELAEMGRLDYASVILADYYGYNYTDDNNLKIDLDALWTEHMFNFNLIHNGVL